MKFLQLVLGILGTYYLSRSLFIKTIQKMMSEIYKFQKIRDKFVYFLYLWHWPTKSNFEKLSSKYVKISNEKNRIYEPFVGFILLCLSMLLNLIVNK